MKKKGAGNAFKAFNPIKGVKGFAVAKKAPASAPVASHQKYSNTHMKNHHWGPPSAPVQLAKIPPHAR